MVPPNRQPARRHLRWALRLTLLGCVGLNIVAALQARAATHFVPGGLSLEQQLAAPLHQKVWALLAGVRIPRPANRATPADHFLPYEVRTIPLGAGEHLEAWHVPHPRPRGVVVMFTGYAAAKEGLLTPAAHFHQFGYTCLLVDFRGAGGSSGSDTTLGIREAEDVVAAFAYAAQAWPGSPLLGYGVSMGAAALMRAVALHGLRPSALILEGPFDRLLTTVRHRFDAVGLPAFPAADLLLAWGSLQIGANGFAHNPVEYAPHVACPALLLRGERDPWISAGEMAAVADAMPASARLVTVPGLGHEMPFVYGAPELWVASVRQFLDET